MFFLKPIITYLEFVFFSKEKKMRTMVTVQRSLYHYVCDTKKKGSTNRKIFFSSYRYRLETNKQKQSKSKKRKRINESKSDNYSESH